MDVRLDVLAPEDEAALADFLVGNRWPFHVREHWTGDQARTGIEEGRFTGADARSFWLEVEGRRVGLATITELNDPTPMLDLRLGESHRGRGFGAAALNEITRWVFQTLPESDRFEGQTRADNTAMRRRFVRCGFAKEAHYRRGWPVSGGPAVDSLGYAILRQDWASGTVTPVHWCDEPAPAPD